MKVRVKLKKCMLRTITEDSIEVGDEVVCVAVSKYCWTKGFISEGTKYKVLIIEKDCIKIGLDTVTLTIVSTHLNNFKKVSYL